MKWRIREGKGCFEQKESEGLMIDDGLSSSGKKNITRQAISHTNINAKHTVHAHRIDREAESWMTASGG